MIGILVTFGELISKSCKILSVNPDPLPPLIHE